MNTTWPGDVILQLRPLPSDVPVDNRLRQALKALLRAHRFRAVVVGAAEDIQRFYFRRFESPPASKPIKKRSRAKEPTR